MGAIEPPFLLYIVHIYSYFTHVWCMYGVGKMSKSTYPSNSKADVITAILTTVQAVSNYI